ncbi:hypothetical protein EWM64_g1660 [Hericium alpestre]|uniref:Uncharacterized protein n=1 Tax=Hericium alpestre TaxID=135208 RepID=A0A4Z0A7U9_9AGAM|nr:hypothetical protein EWM64_g1660 [Hericium alpestre]
MLTRAGDRRSLGRCGGLGRRDEQAVLENGEHIDDGDWLEAAVVMIIGDGENNEAEGEVEEEPGVTLTSWGLEVIQEETEEELAAFMDDGGDGEEGEVEENGLQGPGIVLTLWGLEIIQEETEELAAVVNSGAHGENGELSEQ